MRYVAYCLAVLVAAFMHPSTALGQVAFEELFEWVDSLVLEDRPEALNASPSLRRDPVGGWLVSDRMENQVREYGQDGTLLTFFGREGRGPGEFRHLVGAVRLADRRIAGVDSYGRIGVWSPEGEFEREFSVPVQAVSAVAFSPPASLVMTSALRLTDVPTQATGNRTLAAPVAHLIDMVSGQVTRSIIAPDVDVASLGAWSTVSGGGIEVDTDRYFVTLPLTDTIWEIGSAAHSVTRRVSVSHDLLDHLTEIPNGHTDRAAFDAWIRQAYFVGLAVPADTASFLIALWGLQKEPRLLWLPGESENAVEVIGSPAPLGFDAGTSYYIFRDPHSLEPNRFRMAKLRSSQ